MEPTNTSGAEPAGIEPIEPGWFARCSFPDLAMAVAAIVLFYSLFGDAGFQRLLADSDAGWHIITGERILDTGQLPKVDDYSFTKHGEPWFAWEWLSDIALGWIHRVAGLRGIVFAAALTIALSFWVWARLSRALGGQPLLTAFMIPMAVTCTTAHWLARPHLFSWMFLLSAVWAAEKAPRQFRLSHAALAFAFMAAWANIHASFFLAFIVAGVYVAGYWFTDRARAKWLFWAALCAFSATFVNPYGWHLHEHLARYLANSELQRTIQEFNSFDFQQAGAQWVILLLFLAVAGAVLSVEQRNFGRALLLLVMAVVALRSQRAIPLLALMGLPAVNASLSVALRPVRFLRGLLEESAGFGRFERKMNGFLLAPLILGAAWWLLGTPAVADVTGFPPKRLPVRAAECLAGLPETARVFAPDYFGGYIIYRYQGERKVFFDGRSDFYGLEFVKEFGKLVNLRPGWRAVFERYEFTHALVPVDYPLREKLEDEGWGELCRDQAGVLLAHPRR